MGWVSIFVIAVILVLAFIGLRRGIIKSILSILSIVITMIAVFLFTPAVSEFIKSNTTITNKIYEVVNEKIITEEFFKEVSEEKMVEGLNLPESFKEKILENNTLSNYTQLGVNSFREYVSTTVTDIIFNAVVFCLSFLVIFIVIRLIFAAINLVTKLPVINETNKILGLVFGLAEGLIVVWGFFAIVTMLGSTGIAQDVFEQVNDSAILSFLYNVNPITKYLIKIS